MGALGLSILVVGAAMLLLPGPAIIVIPAGLAVLATEFAWARRLLRRVKKKFDEFYPANADKESETASRLNKKPQERKGHV